jgi:hypothetical protein
VLDEARRQLEASKDGARGPFYAILCCVGSVIVLCGGLREGLLMGENCQKCFSSMWYFLNIFIWIITPKGKLPNIGQQNS